MARITQQVKAIADAHIQARKSGVFDNPSITTKEDVMRQLTDGKTIEYVLDQIEIRFCSITSILMSRHQLYTSKAYQNGVYKGFKILFNL